MITIKELATLAGTSRGTVDRVLNGRGKVNFMLSQRIMELAAEHHYHSNPFARALVNGRRGYRIGIIINSIENKFFDEVLAGIRETVENYRSYGIEVVIKELKGYSEIEQLAALDELLCENLSALAITPMDTPALAARLSALTVPVITLNSDLHFDRKLAFIGCDYLNSGKLSGDLTNLALSSGGTVGIVTGSLRMLGHNQRIAGFRGVVADNPAISIVDVRENNDDNATSRCVTAALIATHHPDLIYFCAAGTEGGVEAVLEANEGTKVIVCDDIAPMRRYLAGGSILGIVTQQPYRQGAAMVETLYNFLAAGRAPATVHRYTENHVRLKSSKEYAHSGGSHHSV